MAEGTATIGESVDTEVVITGDGIADTTTTTADTEEASTVATAAMGVTAVTVEVSTMATAAMGVTADTGENTEKNGTVAMAVDTAEATARAGVGVATGELS